jgi:DNA-binding NtrC family response regulator
VDVRVIAATNRDLKGLVREGGVREDLYYRLRVVPISLPPLRERKDDIPLLVAHFVERFNRQMNRNLLGPTEEAMAALLDYGWPGNVRELGNAVEHAFVRSRGKRFGMEDLPREVWPAERAAEVPFIPDDPEQEKALVLQVLEEAGGNRTKAARILGMSRTTLWKRLKEYGMQ